MMGSMTPIRSFQGGHYFVKLYEFEATRPKYFFAYVAPAFRGHELNLPCRLKPTLQKRFAIVVTHTPAPS